MVWWENDNSFLFGYCRNYVWAVGHVTVSFKSRLSAEKSFFDDRRSERLIFLETQKTEVRIGVVED